MKLAGRVALVTGGGRGIGRAVGIALVAQGAKVALADINHPQAIWKDSGPRGIGGDSALPIQVDVSKPEEVETAVCRLLESFGTIDILVNAAGVQPPSGSLAELNAEDWIRNVSVNLFGTMLCCRAVLPTMMQKKAGRIINFSGGGATGPRPYFSAYACAKTAVVRFTEVLAEEVREFGIDVNAIAPGAVNTKMLDEIIDAGRRAGNREWEEAVRRRETGGTPPEKAADLVAFLASDESTGITGKLISAPWDPWREEGFRDALRREPELATLRRIDNKYFFYRTP